jgi:hypothetical protein
MGLCSSLFDLRAAAIWVPSVDEGDSLDEMEDVSTTGLSGLREAST